MARKKAELKDSDDAIEIHSAWRERGVRDYLDAHIGRGRPFKRKDLAPVVGRKNEESFGKIQRGDQIPSIDQVVALARHTGMSLDAMFGIRVVGDERVTRRMANLLAQLAQAAGIPPMEAVNAILKLTDSASESRASYLSRPAKGSGEDAGERLDGDDDARG